MLRLKTVTTVATGGNRLSIAALAIPFDGNNAVSSLAAKLALSTVPVIYFDEPNGQVLANGAIDCLGKTFVFQNGCKLVGNAILSNVIIDAPLNKAIFATTVQLDGTAKNNIVSPEWWGASAGASSLTNNLAFRRVREYVQAKGGYTTISLQAKGSYRVGQQTKQDSSAGFPNAYASQDLLKFTSCTDVTIEGNGSTLLAIDGLKVGSWNPVTETAYTPPVGYFADMYYYATPGTMVYFKDCQGITVKNLILDGNAQNFLLGGRWGSGFETGGIGIQVFNTADFVVDNVVSKNQLTDGLGIVNNSCGSMEALQKVVLRNSKFIYNGRQGFSWDGGNHLQADNCDFSHTGQVFNGAIRVVSGPSGGVDIEPELGPCGQLVCSNGVFDNCRFEDNIGVSFLCVGGPGRGQNIQVNGGRIENNATGAIWANAENVTFTGVAIIGTVITGFAATSYDDTRRTKWIDCTFSQKDADYFRAVDITNSNTSLNNFAHQYALLQRCTFDLAAHVIFIADTEIQDCVIKTTATAESIVHGLHKGNNSFTGPHYNLDAAVIQGKTTVNGVLQRIAFGVGTDQPQEYLHLKNLSGVAQTMIESVFSSVPAASFYGPFGQYGTILSHNVRISDGSFYGEAIADKSKAVAVTLGGSYLLEAGNYAGGNYTTRFRIAYDGSLTVAVSEYADNAAATAAGLSVGKLYRTGDVLKIVH